VARCSLRNTRRDIRWIEPRLRSEFDELHKATPLGAAGWGMYILGMLLMVVGLVLIADPTVTPTAIPLPAKSDGENAQDADCPAAADASVDAPPADAAAGCAEGSAGRRPSAPPILQPASYADGQQAAPPDANHLVTHSAIIPIRISASACDEETSIPTSVPKPSAKPLSRQNSASRQRSPPRLNSAQRRAVRKPRRHSHDAFPPSSMSAEDAARRRLFVAAAGLPPSPFAMVLLSRQGSLDGGRQGSLDGGRPSSGGPLSSGSRWLVPPLDGSCVVVGGGSGSGSRPSSGSGQKRASAPAVLLHSNSAPVLMQPHACGDGGVVRVVDLHSGASPHNGYSNPVPMAGSFSVRSSAKVAPYPSANSLPVVSEGVESGDRTGREH
jgi:hypothetical protein